MEIFYGSYAETKRFLRQFYKNIGQIWCPVLNDYIVFTRRGFDHLIGKGDIVRPKSEQKRRFSLLPYVQDILIYPHAEFSYETKLINEKNIHYWKFTGAGGGMHITIIIKQTPKGKKQFLTVYGKKQKSTL